MFKIHRLMKKILIFAVLALLVCASASARDRRRGASTTEVIYPVIGDWNMSVVSCKGNSVVGQVILTLGVTRLTPQTGFDRVRALLTEVRLPGGAMLDLARRTSDPFYDLKPGQTVEVVFQPILGVPTSARMLNARFFLRSDQPDWRFELRGVPIDWDE